jgi:hypothetical protein
VFDTSARIAHGYRVFGATRSGAKSGTERPVSIAVTEQEVAGLGPAAGGAEAVRPGFVLEAGRKVAFAEALLNLRGLARMAAGASSRS